MIGKHRQCPLYSSVYDFSYICSVQLFMFMILNVISFKKLYVMIFSFVLVILGIAMKKEHLSIYSFNATSISGTEKLSTFNNSFSGHSYDLIAITETWFHDGIYDEEVLPNCNYDIFRRDRCPETSAKESGGGIMLAVHKSLPAIRRREFETTAEMLWVHIMPEKLMLVHIIYQLKTMLYYKLLNNRLLL